jgi:hypothetical protein
VARHKVFREGFARFKPGSVTPRACDLEVPTLKLVNDSSRERGLASNDRQVDRLGRRVIGKSGDIRGVNVDTVCDLSDSGVAGSAMKIEPIALAPAESPQQRVLSTTGAYDQDFHVGDFSWISVKIVDWSVRMLSWLGDAVKKAPERSG